MQENGLPDKASLVVIGGAFPFCAVFCLLFWRLKEFLCPLFWQQTRYNNCHGNSCKRYCWYDAEKSCDIKTRTSDSTLYRMRVCSLRKDVSRTEIFHIPFSMIRNIKTQRYSTPGYPCLYLAKSIYGSWEEMHRPPIESTLVSQFTSKENFRVLDLRIPSVERFTECESLYLKYLPVIIACMNIYN